MATGTRPPEAWERPWPFRPCRTCYERALEVPSSTRRLAVLPDCPRCLGSGVESLEPTAPAGGGES